jgi:hypothetical protein
MQGLDLIATGDFIWGDFCANGHPPFSPNPESSDKPEKISNRKAKELRRGTGLKKKIKIPLDKGENIGYIEKL